MQPDRRKNHRHEGVLGKASKNWRFENVLTNGSAVACTVQSKRQARQSEWNQQQENSRTHAPAYDWEELDAALQLATYENS
jgi:hypothetical protein